MKTPGSEHLRLSEIEAAASGALSRARLAHVGACEVCAESVRDFAELMERLPRTGPGQMEPAGECPGLEELARWIAGELEPTVAERMMAHASQCGHCAAIVKGALAEESVTETVTRRRAIGFPARRWMALAASVLLAAGGLVWVRARANQPERLLAAAYTQMRPFDFRLADAGHGPIQQQRAGGGSALDRPRSLSEAEIAIKGGLERTPDSASLLALQGRAELLEGRFDPAIEALTRAQEAGAHDASALADLGCAYALRGDAEHRAIDHGHALELLLQALKLRPREPRFLFNLALVYQRLSLIDEAIEAWTRYLQVEAAGAWADEARKSLAELETRRRKRDAAWERLKPDIGAFLALSRSQPELVDAEQFQDIAWMHWLPSPDGQAREAARALGELWMARYRDSSLLDAARTPPAFDAWKQLATAVEKNRAGDYDDAAPLAVAAAGAFGREGNRAAEMRSLIEVSYARQRADTKSCEAISELRKRLEKTDYRWLLAQTMIQEGICSFRTGDNGTARGFYLRAAEMSGRLNFWGLHLRALSMADSAIQTAGNLPGEWEAVRSGLALYWEHAAAPNRAHQLEFDIARGAARLGWHQAASVYGLAAVRDMARYGNRALEALSRIYVAGTLSSAGEHAGAEEQVRMAEKLFEAQTPSDTRDNLLLNASVTQAEVGELGTTEAVERLKRLDASVSGRTWDVRLRSKQVLGRSLAQSGDVAGAERTFREAIEIHQAEVAHIADTERRVGAFDVASDSYKGLVAIQMARTHDAMAALHTWDVYRGVSAEAAAPSGDTAALVYAVTPSGVAAWVLANGAVQGQMLEMPLEAARMVQQRFLRACSRADGADSAFRADAQQLYRWLVAPLATRLAGARMLVIDADDWLAGVPFEALLDGEGRYLGNTHAIAMADRGAASRPPSRVDPQGRSLIVAAGNLGAKFSHRFPPLPSAEEEARAVAVQFPAPALLIGESASLAAVEKALDGVTLFHFAGHGWANAGDGGLVLASAAGDPALGYLESTGLAKRDWSRCQTVVLSACMTAAGESRGPFNPRSLVRAFLSGGASRVVASRWNVDGTATTSLMRHFYRALAAGRSPAESLLQARLALQKESGMSAPYYWAAFTLFGKL